MTRKNEEFAINNGPPKLNLMLSLFDTDMGKGKETPDDAKRARALMFIIHKMVAIGQNHGGLPDEFYVLFDKAKRIKFADDGDSLTKAVNNI